MGNETAANGLDITPDPTPVPEPIPFPQPDVAPDVTPDDRIALGAKRMYARAKEHLRQSLSYAAQQNPDTYAKNVQVADKLGVQPDLVDGSPDLHAAATQQDQDVTVDRITRDHPELAKWLTDPSNASLVHDDLGAMRTLDVALRAASDLTVDPSGYLPPGFAFSDQGEIIEPLPGGLSTVVGGFKDLDRVLATRAARQADEEDQLRGLYQQGGDSRFLAGAAASLASTKAALGLANDADRAYADRIAAASSLVHPGFGSGLIRGAGGLFADLPLMLAGGGVLKGAKYATDVWKLGGQLGRIAEPVRIARRALQAAGKVQTYLSGALEAATVSQPLAIREGLSTADEHGGVNGALAWAIETAVPGTFGKTGTEAALAMTAAERRAKTLAVGDTWLHVAREIAKEGAYEGAEESVTELAHAIHERVSGMDPRALESDRLVSRLASAGILGAAAGGGFAVPHEAIAKLSQDLLAHDEAITFRNRMGAVATAVGSNPLTVRAPERMHGLIQAQTGNLQLFYQTDEWDEHWQAQGIDPIRAADLFGIRDSYLTARAHGGEMAVPLSHVVMPSTDPALPKDVPGLLDLGRQAPGAPNAKQADTFDEEAKQQVADLVKANTPAPEPVAQPDLGEVIGGQLAAKLEAVGRSKTDAAAYGQLFGTIFRTLGERLGVNPQTLADRFPVSIEKGNEEVPRGTNELEQRTPAGEDVSLKNAEGLRARAEAFARGELDTEVDRNAETGVFPAVSAAETETAATFEHAGEGQRRASIAFGPDRSATIRLFKTANRSSMLHEMGHLWLEVLGDLSQDENAPQRIKDDYAAALSFLGVEKRSDIETKHHETFARGFEQYLATGKAPSISMRRLFARFGAWLLKTYKDLRRLKVTLSPEIVGVFDRLVATDEEIAAAEHQAAVQPIFSTPEQAGKTPEQFAAYRTTVEDAHTASVAELQAELVSRYKEEEEAAYREERDAVRAAAAQEIGVAPVFQALSALQDGLPDGTAPKLSKSGVLEYVSADNLALLPGPAVAGQERPNRGRRVYTTDVEQGIHPDQAAGLFQFESGDALIRALIAAPDLETLIDARTDDVMKERHPDAMTDGQLKERAQAAIQSDEREKVVRDELSALRALERAARPVVKQAGSAREVGTRLLRDAALPLPVYREAAKQIVSGMTVANIRPKQYLVAAATNARKAFGLVNKAKPTVDDYAEAAQAKEQELLSMELYRAARDAVESTEKTRAFLEGFQDEKTRQRIGKAGGWEWTVSKPDGSVERVSSEAEARKLAVDEGGTFERSSGYLEQIDALLERFDLSKARRGGPTLARRESLRDWLMRLEVDPEGNPTGVVADIPDLLRDEAFSTNWRSLTMGDLESLRDAVANIAHLANTNNRLLRQANKRTVDETVDDIIGSIEEHGPNKREVRANRTALDGVGNFFEGYLAAHRKMASLARMIDGGKDGGAAWEAIIRPLNEAANAELEESGKASAKLMSLLKEWGKPDGPVKAVPELGGAELSTIGKVMVALNWGSATSRQRVLNEGWSSDQMAMFLSTLDASDLKLINGIWELVGSYWSDIKAKMQRMTGLPAERVEAIPFEVTTADGTVVKMTGGYFPIVYDDARSPNHSALTTAAQAELAMRGASMRATTARGHEKTRQKVVAGKRLLFSPSVITGHLNQVIHDLTHHEVIRDASRLLSDKRLAKEMHDRYGPQMAKQFRKGLEDVAAGEMGASDMVERSVRWIRSGVSIAAMGFNATSALMQITGLSQSMVRVGPKYMGKAIGRMFRDAASLENSAAFVDAKSGFMKARGTTMIRELREAIHRSDVGVARRRLTQAAYFMMAKMQRAVDVPTWLASYEKSLDGGKSDADAVAIADQTIIDTQGSGFVKDLSAVQRNKALAIFTPFMHYLSVQMNLTAESVSRLRKTGDVVRFGSDMLLLYALPAVFAVLLKDLLRGAPEDDEDSFTKRAAKEGLSMLLGTTLVTREAGAIFQSDRDYAGPAGSRGLAALVNFGHQALQGELDHGLEKASIEVLGMALRLPTVAVQRLVDAAVSDSQDNQVRAALFGKRPQK